MSSVPAVTDKHDQTSLKPRRSILFVAVIIALPLLVAMLSISIGRYSVSPAEVILGLGQWSVLIFGKVVDLARSLLGLSAQSAGIDPDIGLSSAYNVVINLRLPRVAAALLVGASLAVSGTAFQSLFRNPLVSSGILGVSSGAGFGAALAIILSMQFAAPFFAFFFAVTAVILAYFAGRFSGGDSQITLVLGGTIVGSIFSALLSLLQYIANPLTQLPAITFWLMGSLASIKMSDLWLSVPPMIVGITGLFLMRWRLNILSMGDREARTLGVNVGLNKGIVIGLATMATAGAVCLAGVIGWIGLVVPHMCRMVIGSDNKWLVPASISVGACFMVIVDTICRNLISAEIPLGIVTAIVGGPFFIYLLKKTKVKSW
jgi:iron complex transport system permease protein